MNAERAMTAWASFSDLARRALVLAGLLAAAGCTVLTGPSQAPVHYVLTDPRPVPKLSTQRQQALLVREMDVPAFYQDPRLVHSRAPGTRSHYEYARWSDPPGRRLSWLLRQRLEAAGGFAVVAPFAAGVTGEYQLNTRLIDLYHDSVSLPGTALVVIEASLLRRETASQVGRRVFVGLAPVRRADADAAADAMSEATNQVLDEIVLWIDALFSRGSSGTAGGTR